MNSLPSRWIIRWLVFLERVQILMTMVLGIIKLDMNSQIADCQPMNEKVINVSVAGDRIFKSIFSF